jgi:competence protein ComEC
VRVPLKSTILWAGAAAIGFGAGTVPESLPTRLTFLAVGQGDCAVFQHAGATILIDAGPGNRESDSGRRVVFPKLRAMGVDRIDVVFLTHPDADHVAGLRSLRRLLPISKVAMSGHFRQNDEMKMWLGEFGMSDSQMLWLGDSARVRVGDFQIGLESPAMSPGTADNEGSLFARIEGDGASALLSGDANEETELKMLRKSGGPVEVLKAGHHGSRTSCGTVWLNSTHPNWVVISCGRENRYGHPAKQTLQRISNAKAKLARTDLEGDIVFELRNGDFVRVD